jgi:uncharacterized protein
MSRDRTDDNNSFDHRDARRRSRDCEGDEYRRPSKRECWRCGKLVDTDRARCPFCRATLNSRRRYVDRDDETFDPIGRDTARTIKALLWSFFLLLSISIVQAWYLHFGPGLPEGPKQEQEMALLQLMLVAEAFDAAFVVLALVWVTIPRPIRRSATSRIAAWSIGAPVLALLLGINLLYGKALQEFVGRQPHLEIIEVNLKTHFGLVLFAMCVVPAVVEELFFRYLALGHLRKIMSDHAAVWVSAAMFGFAHIHNPAAIPVLVVVGAGLGYMRLMSGGLALPILIHGLHNAFILALEGKV